MLKIYGFQSFNTLKVLLTAEELSLSYEFISLDPTKGEHKTPEHMKRHPLGKVPVIEHDGRHLFESNSICRYLASIDKKNLYPEEIWSRAEIDQWVDYSTQHPGKWLAIFFFEEVINKKFHGKKADQAAMKEAQEWLDQQLPVLDNQLGKATFLTGASICIADIITFSYLTTTEVTSLEITKYKYLNRWYGEMKSRPSFANANSKFQPLM